MIPPLAASWWKKKVRKALHCKVLEDRADETAVWISLSFQSLSVARPPMEMLATCCLTEACLNFRSRQYGSFFSTTVFFFYIYSLFFLIKINLLMIFPVIVRGDFLLLLFLYCKLPQLPSQSVLVRTLFCSWYEPEYPLASTLNLPLTNMKGKKLTIWFPISDNKI